MADRLVTLPIRQLPAAQYCVVWSQKSAMTTNARRFLALLREGCRGYGW